MKYFYPALLLLFAATPSGQKNGDIFQEERKEERVVPSRKIASVAEHFAQESKTVSPRKDFSKNVISSNNSSPAPLLETLPDVQEAEPLEESAPSVVSAGYRSVYSSVYNNEPAYRSSPVQSPAKKMRNPASNESEEVMFMSGVGVSSSTESSPLVWKWNGNGIENSSSKAAEPKPKTALEPPGPPHYTKSSIETLDAVADGIDSAQIKVILRDVNDNIVSGFTPDLLVLGDISELIDCSLSDANGESFCEIKSLITGEKLLSFSNITDLAGSVNFAGGMAIAGNSSMSVSSPIVANGSDHSIVTIIARDAHNNLVPDFVPTISVDGSGNTVSACSATNSSGVSTCTISSTVAESKTVSVSNLGGMNDTAVFISGLAAVSHSSISATSPIVADGSTTSTVTITLRDSNNNPIAGDNVVITVSGTGNNVGSCSPTNVSGVSTCNVSSTVAETKTVSVDGMVLSTPIVFTASSVDASESTIVATTPTLADGSATSTVTITLKDANGNPVAGEAVAISVTGTGNSVGSCSPTNASGVSTCTVSSTVAESKTVSVNGLSLSTTTVFTSGGVDASESTIVATTPTLADGSATSTVTITLKDANGNPVAGEAVAISVTGSGNSVGSCSPTNASGVSTCNVSSTVAETKTVSVNGLSLSTTTVFTSGGVDASESSIVATTPTLADGSATSTVTITLKDTNGNPVAGEAVAISVTGSGNSVGSCSTTNASGVSTCNISSTVAESKTVSVNGLSLSTTTVFTHGPAVAANSSITATSPVVANGVSTSTVTVTLKDAHNNPVTTGSWDIDVTGTSNAWTCGSLNSSGVMSCTLSSFYVETKTVSVNDLSDLSTTVSFIAGGPLAGNSIISATGGIANNMIASNILIELKDANNNPIVGFTPILSIPEQHTIGIPCSGSNSAGWSMCTINSTVAGVKNISVSNVSGLSTTAVFAPGVADLGQSEIVATDNIPSDGTSQSTVTITLRDAFGNARTGTPVISATGGASVSACSALDSAGISVCYVTSTTDGSKTITVDMLAGLSTSVTFVVPQLPIIASSASGEIHPSVERFITLPYNSDDTTAETCSVSNLTNMTVVTACSCTAGLCRVGVTATGGTNASFDFTLTNSQGSDSNSGSFTVFVSRPFITRWDTRSGASNKVCLPLDSNYTSRYNFTVDWGDGSPVETFTNTITACHTYSTNAQRDITIEGSLPSWGKTKSSGSLCDNGMMMRRLIEIKQWGNIAWENLSCAFSGVIDLVVSASDAPNLSNVTDLSYMFSNISGNAELDLRGWDVSNITNMKSIFASSAYMSLNVSGWDVSNVRNLSNAFSTVMPEEIVGLPTWDVSNVEDMSGMFAAAYLNAGDLSGWDVSNVKNMGAMFHSSAISMGNITGWDVSNVTNMSEMFFANGFNQNISGWDVSNVTNMSSMFEENPYFVQNISGWDVGKVINATGFDSGTSASWTAPMKPNFP